MVKHLAALGTNMFKQPSVKVGTIPSLRKEFLPIVLLKPRIVFGFIRSLDSDNALRTHLFNGDVTLAVCKRARRAKWK